MSRSWPRPERTLDHDWLPAVVAALDHDDESDLLDALRPLLGTGAVLASWRPDATGWTPLHGDDVPVPDDAPDGPGIVAVDHGHVLRAGADPTASRLLLVVAPDLADGTAATVAHLLRLAVERLVERRTAGDALQRLADNERIGSLGSYDWHVPTDTNRWSDQLYRIYGEEPGSFHPSYERFIGFIHPDDRDRVRAIHQEAFATGEPYEMEERIVLRDGTERLLWSNGEVIPGPDGAPEHFIGICRDVTDQRAAERAAAEAEEHRQSAHDAEVRRRAALELNDVVVQGLTAAAWADDVGQDDIARQVLEQTLANARRMMDDLLVGHDEAPPVAGELRRTAAPGASITTSPVAAAPEDEAPTEAGAAGAGDHEGRPDDSVRPRVVLADDAPDVRLLLSLQLETMGLDVVGQATNGREAVELTAEHAPDIVLLDLSMPEMDGLEAATEIRSARPDVTIVVISGYAADTMRGRALEAGADGYLEKGRDLPGRLAPLLGVPG